MAGGLLAGDEGFDVAGELVDAVALGLIGEEALLGEAGVEAVAGDEAVDVAEAADVAAGVVLEQLGSGLGMTPSLPIPSELVVVLVLGLGLGLGLGDVWGVVVGLSLGLGLGLELGVALALGLLLALAEALAPELTGLPLLWLPLGDVAGAVAVPVVLLGELFLVSVTDGCVDGDEQGLGVVCAATPGRLGDGAAAAEGAGVVP